MRTTRLLALALLVAASTGCGQKKVAECNAVVQVINAGVVSLEKAPRNEADATGVSDLKAMAEAMDKIAAQTAGLPLTLPDLKKLRDEYQKMSKEIAKAERDLAAAAQDRDTARRSAAEAALDAAVKLEDPLVDQINKFCQAP
jgi:hypothetical protein